MVSSIKPQTLQEETSSIINSRFSIDLIEVFSGSREGSEQERERLASLHAELGERIYAEMLYVLLHKVMRSNHEAKKLFEGIVQHKRELERVLERETNLTVAALDYVSEKGDIFASPTIIEEHRVRELVIGARPKAAPPDYDRNAFLFDLGREIERTKRYGSSFSLVFIDLDNLRSINECYGRSSGDIAVRRLAELLWDNTRAVDIAYRTGGDEFVLLLPNSDLTVAMKVAEKLLRAIRETTIGHPGKTFSVTASMGAASFNDQTVQNVDGILHTTEMLLNEAKRSGKNRIKILHQDGREKSLQEIVEENTREEPAGSRFVIKGLSISPGIAFGKAFIHRDILNDEMEYYEVEEGEIEKELERVRNAISHVKNDITRMEHQVRQNLGREYADIFVVHKAILSDISVISEMENRLRSERMNAEHIVKTVFKRFENKFIMSENEVTREKYLDIADLSRRILRYLRGVNRNIFGKLPRNRIVVSKRLLPSESVHLRKGNVRAIITEKGSMNSHAAILARGLGIPYVSETELSIDRIRQDDNLIVDAGRGEIIVNPSRKEIEEMHATIRTQKERHREILSKLRRIELRRGDRTVRVMANANSKNSIDEAVEYGCDGIGLFRTEQIYLQSTMFPTQEQLIRTFRELFAGVRDKEITVRLLDIGGDKKLPYLNMREEVYSFMGLRGVRVLLRYPRILETQLLALLKLSREFRLKILVPMVTLAEEMATVRSYLQKCMLTLEKDNIGYNRKIPLGSMIEVPAAVVRIEDLLKHSDFVSIGTNDLIQYTVASGRENAMLARYYEAGTDIVLSYIRHVLEKARERGIECDLCGEIAADTSYTDKLLELGLDNFSVAPSSIPKLKGKIAEYLGIERETAKELASSSS